VDWTVVLSARDQYVLPARDQYVLPAREHFAPGYVGAVLYAGGQSSKLEGSGPRMDGSASGWKAVCSWLKSGAC
jgi:hypothetical protein